MRKLSLDAEPPPRFRGEKEVRKKNKNLPQLIFSIRNDRNSMNKDKSPASMKNIEKRIKPNLQEYSPNENYPSLEKYFSEENQNFTLKNIEFAKTENTYSNPIIHELNYSKRKEENLSPDKKVQNFYGINSSYSFAEHQTFTKDGKNKENLYSESKEQEEKDVLYALHTFEEEKKEEGIVII